MKYKLHDNGWAVILEDFDFNNATVVDIKEITKLLTTNTIVIAKKQNLSVEKELEILNMFASPTPLFNRTDASFEDTKVDKDGIICRVTAELNDNGKPGIGANPNDFDWHANLPWLKDRKSIIWLYGVKGTKNSRTSYTNSILAYNDLTLEFKNKIKDLKQQINGGKRHSGSMLHSSDIKKDWHPSVIISNSAGITGIYFPFLNVIGFDNLSIEEGNLIKQELTDHIMQEKYIYHHDWDDGDVVIADQWFGLHKRWFFESLEKRLLHRAAIEYLDLVYYT
jgi:alpha-ketoglutarate-dependent taurine dioxygenase